MYWGKGSLFSFGPSSDDLLKTIDFLYHSKVGATKFAKEVSFEAVSLEGDPTQLHRQPVKLKLFFNSDNEADYAEVYLNIDLQKETVQLNEKDADYRKNIVRALQAK